MGEWRPSGGSRVAADEIDHPWIDSSRAPLHVWCFPRHFTDEELRACIDAHRAWRAGVDHPVAWVIDLTHAKNATTAQRRMLADHVAASEPHDVRWNRGTAFVIPNAIVRATVMAVLWMRHPLFETHLVSTLEDGLSWATGRLPPLSSSAERPCRPGGARRRTSR